MTENLTTIKEEPCFKDGMVHYILSHSYMVFFLAVMVGVIVDILVPVIIFKNPIFQYIGFTMIIIGSSLIYWAQSATSTPKEQTNTTKEKDFERGPYKYSRNPTHTGMAIMTLGLGLLLNSFFTVICILVAYLISKFIFLKKEERILEDKYGQTYLNYKKKVKSWV